MRPWLIYLILIGNFFLPYGGIKTQEPVVFLDPQVAIDFGKKIIFEVTIAPVTEVSEVYLSLRPQGRNTRVQSAIRGENGKITAQFDARLDPLHPFTSVEYWYSVVTQTGQKVESDHYSFEYNDNRFPWKTLGNDQFVIYWYSGNLAFGQAALNAAGDGLKAAQNYLEAKPLFPVNIYIYETSADLQSSLQTGQQSWIAGHASPDTSLILISIAPGEEQQLEFERQIPHEIMHLLQFQIFHEDYNRIPIWLIEGSASQAELYPNPDYQWALEKAASQETLIPINSICTSFPREASGAFLAYAESASFVNYLYDKYGRSSMLTLFNVYSDGLGCEEGTMAAFGRSLSQLENLWQEEALGMHPGLLALRNLSPYLSLSIVLLIIPLAVGFLALKK